MRILVIEDDPTVGQYVKRGLEEHRWAVDLMTDGEEGERRASSEAYDLIVLDMRLPGKSGLDVLQSLVDKNLPDGSGLDVIRHLKQRRPDAEAILITGYASLQSAIVAVENPFFAVSGDDGSFNISNLPPGDYTLTAWHEQLGTKEIPVKVETGKPAEVKISFSAP